VNFGLPHFELKPTLIAVGLVVLIFATRLLHLANHSYYWIVNADSFYFHHLATLAHNGQAVAFKGSGLAYLLRNDPHTLTILMPVAIALLIALMLAVYVRHLYGKNMPYQMAVVFMFAMLIPAIFITEAGNVDRDGLELLLMIPALFSYYFMVNALDKPMEALVYAIPCAASMGLLVWLWSPIAIPIMLSIVTVYTLWQKHSKRAILLCLVVVALGMVAYAYSKVPITGTLSQEAAELHPIQLGNIITYLPIALPLVAGIRYMAKQRRSHEMFLLTWLLVSFAEGIAMSRLLLFIIPPVCIVSGIGLVEFYKEFMQPEKRRILYIISGLAVVTALIFPWYNFADAIMPSYWVKACQWIKQNTPADSVVVSWWDHGTWIQDVGERYPYVSGCGDNHSPEQDKAVAMIYCATDDSVAANLLTNRGTYVILSSVERHYFSAIKGKAGYHGKNEATLWGRALKEGYQSDWFAVVYQDKSIVVLEVKGEEGL
jgi:asparagine N-glycosylation enzyme membrane subunit Stt3